MSIVIVDYHKGNLLSVERGLVGAGADVVVTDKADVIRAADAVVLAARDGKFLSRDDFRNRTKVSKSVIDRMSDLGIFGDLPESNQISLFDFQS